MDALKTNHHYVSQFWLRGFADSNGHIHAWDGKHVRVVAAANIMTEDWLYTVFNNHWEPSNQLEDMIAKLESKAAPVFTRLCNPASVVTSADRDILLEFLALQACRHPDVLRTGYRRSRQMGEFFAAVHSVTKADFITTAGTRFGVTADDAAEFYDLLVARPPSQLDAELNELKTLSPQDPRLPQQDALQATQLIRQLLLPMDVTLIDASPGTCFVLGDTPLPQDQLRAGFSVPLSKSTAAIFQPPGPISQGAITRRTATAAEVRRINHMQWSLALKIIIGPDKNVLTALT